MTTHRYCVIMAGGIGSRFWPISREARPKQFLDFAGKGFTFLRETYDRFSRIIPKENILVVSLDKYRDMVFQQIPELDERNLLLEPYRRDTAPSIALAAYTLLKRDPQAVMVASPADHQIQDYEMFDQTLLSALQYAEQGDSLITLGIIPDRPDTNFGYIQVTGGGYSDQQGKLVKVKTFTEKPDATLAEVFVKSGEFLWNAGIFVWKASAIVNEMEKYLPEVTRLFSGWEDILDTEAQKDFLSIAYADMKKISVDYGVMEKTDLAWVIPSDFGWADIGNWESMYGYLAAKDKDGNATRSAKQLFQETADNIVFSSSSKKLIVLKDLKDHIVIDTSDVLMICPRDDAKLKEIISSIGLPEYKDYR